MWRLSYIIIFAVRVIRIKYLYFFILQLWIFDHISLFSPSLPIYPQYLSFILYLPIFDLFFLDSVHEWNYEHFILSLPSFFHFP